MNSMPQSKSVLAIVALSLGLCAAKADECEQVGAREIQVEIRTSEMVRQNAPTELFGFNVPWRDFQLGYFRNGSVRPELIELLAPFKGATYRYPGGSPSNWFEWRKAVGPIMQRPMLHADFDRYDVVKFGVNEFADFVNQVKGRAVLTLNMNGPYKEAKSPNEIAADNLELLKYVRDNTSFKCVTGLNCGVMAWELGNELDWGPYNWPASVYLTRANSVISAIAPVIPNVQWIANGRTAPWDSKSANYSTYNGALANGLADQVQGIAIHPYYDGISIPSAAKYVFDFWNAWSNVRPSAKVFVTEHARWPSQKNGAPWESSWYQATSVGGAISSVDFLLTLAGMPEVASANWHALGVEGPWQLVRWNKSNDTIYASPIYWGLRAIREAYLDHVVVARYSQPIGTTYSGGYDVRMIGMVASNNSMASVLGINRSNNSLKIRVKWVGSRRNEGMGLLRTVSSVVDADDNTQVSPQKVIMKIKSNELSAGRAGTTWCVPAHSVFSVAEP